MAEVWEAVQHHRRTLEEHGELTQRRADQQVQWMWAMVRDQLMDRLQNDAKHRIGELESRVRAGDLTPTLAATSLLATLGLPG
jgi:LAO/AO transport system kinase